MKIIERKTMTVGELLDLNLNFKPGYQRENDIWSKAKQVDLIETILLGDTINTIHTRQIREVPSELLDGQQRLTAILQRLNSDDIEQDETNVIRNHPVSIENHKSLTYAEAVEKFRKINKNSPLTNGEKRKAIKSKVNEILAPYKGGNTWLERLFQHKREKTQENLEKILYYSVNGVSGATATKLDKFHQEQAIDATTFNYVMSVLSSVFETKEKVGEFRWWDLAMLTQLLVHYNKHGLTLNLDPRFLETWAMMKGELGSNRNTFSRYRDKRDLTPKHMHHCVAEFKRKFEESGYWAHGDVQTKLAPLKQKKTKKKKKK